MKHLRPILAAAAVCLSTTSLASEPLNFGAINASIQSALSEFHDSAGVIDSLKYSLVPERTNANHDRYGYDVELMLKKMPWGNGELKASGNFELMPAGASGIKLSFDATYETDALGLLKYKVAMVSRCEAGPKRKSDVFDVFMKRHCEYVEQLAQISTVIDLYDLLAQKIEAHRTDVKGYITELEGTVALLARTQAESGAHKLLKDELVSANSVLEFIDGVLLTKTDDGFTLAIPAFDGCPILASSGVSLKVSSDKILEHGDVTLKFGKSLLVAARPAAKEILRGLERGKFWAKKIVRLDARVFAELITNVTAN